MSNPSLQRLRRFRFNLPQRIAALLLLCFLGQWAWLNQHTPLTRNGYRVAACGAQMWLPGDFSDPSSAQPSAQSALSCGGVVDGVLAYRLAGLPVALHQIFTQMGSRSGSGYWSETGNKSGNKSGNTYGSASTGRATADSPQASALNPISVAEAISGRLLLLLRLPFLLAGLILGGCLWWVTRRLFGNVGGYLALGFYCFSPQMLIYSLVPNNEILAACGFFAAFYTAIGVGHALQGPRRKWRKRIVLMIATLGFTVAAHTAAFLLVLVASLPPLIWVAEKRRKYLPELTLFWSAGAVFLLGVAHGLNPAAVAAAFVDGLGGLRLSPQFVPQHLAAITTLPLLLLLFAALAVYGLSRRSRYFGNTLPLLVLIFLLLVSHTGDGSIAAAGAVPWIWAAPFLLTFVGGIFADALETRLRWPALIVGGLLLAAQIWLCLHALPVEAWVGLLA